MHQKRSVQLSIAALLCAGAPCALGQGTPPPGNFNVADHGLITAPSCCNGEPERLTDGGLNSGWFVKPLPVRADTTACLVWANPTDFMMTRIDLRNDTSNRFREVVVTVLDKAGAIVVGPTMYNESSGWGAGGVTLEIPVNAEAASIRLDFSDAVGSTLAGFLEMWVWTARPGRVNPIGSFSWSPNGADGWGGAVHEPQVRDDELLVFSNDGPDDTTGAHLAYEGDGFLDWEVRERAVTTGSTVVAAASGRVLGDAVEQVAIVRRSADDEFRVDLVDMYNGRYVVRGTYPFTPANPDSDVCVVVAELDDSNHPELSPSNIVEARRCSDVALAYEVVGDDGMRRMHIDLLSWTNITREDLHDNVVRSPNVLSQVTLDTDQNGLNVGQLLHQDGTPNRMRLTWGRLPFEGHLIAAHAIPNASSTTVQVATLSAYQMRTDPNFTPLSSGLYQGNGIRVDLDTDPEAGLGDTWEIAVGRYDTLDHLGDTVRGDYLAVITAQLGAGNTRNVRINAGAWDDDLKRFVGGRVYTANLGDDVNTSPRPSVNILPDSRISSVNIPWTSTPRVQRALAVLFHTNRGPIIQTYDINVDRVSNVVDLGANSGLTYPNLTAHFLSRGTYQSPTNTSFTGGLIPFLRTNLGSTPGAQARLMIKPPGSVSELEVLDYKVPFTQGLRESTLALRSADGSAPATYDDVVMIPADIDGDSAWHDHTAGGTTIRLGMGSRLGFDNVATPTVVLEEPPRHADYLRSSGQVVNVSRYSGFNAEFTNQSSTTREFTREAGVAASHSERRGYSVTATTSVEVPAIEPSYSATVSSTYAEAVSNLAEAARSRSVGSASTYTVSDTYVTSAGDQVVFRNRDFDMWNYPVMGQSLAEGLPAIDPVVRLCIPAGDRLTVVTGGTDAAAAAYQPEHLVGNILSYPWYAPGTGQTVAVARFTPRTNGFLRNGQPSASPFPNNQFTQYSVGTTDATHTVQFDNSNNSSDSYSSAATTSKTTEFSVTAEVTASASFFSGVVGISGSLSGTTEYSTEATQSFSQMATRSISSSVQNQFVLNVRPVASSNRSYNFLPMMWFDRSGAIRVSHLVNVPSSGSTFWGQNYRTPDPALNLPRRIVGLDDDVSLSTDADRAIMKAYEVRDDRYGVGYPADADPDNPLSRNAVLSAALDGGSAADGQQLTLRARVYNLALNVPESVATGVLVRFEAQEVMFKGSDMEIGPRMIVGETTIDSIPGQENRWAQVTWDTTDLGPCFRSDPSRTYRIYVIVDPDDTIAGETHELFDRDSNPLLDPDTMQPLDAYQGRTLEMGQNNLGWFSFSIYSLRDSLDCTLPRFIETPDDTAADAGDTADFFALAQGCPEPTLRWRRNGIPLTDGVTADGSIISGATTPVLTIENVQPSDAGNYRAAATNDCGTRTSPRATLEVADACPADFNEDGLANSQDYFDFLTAFFAQAPEADFNDDGVINSQDYFDFLTAFFAGC